MSRKSQQAAAGRLNQKRTRNGLEEAGNPARSSIRMDIQPPSIPTQYNRITVRSGGYFKRPRVTYARASLVERFRRPVNWDGGHVDCPMDEEDGGTPSQPMPPPVRRVVDLFWAARDQRLAEEESTDVFVPPNLQEAAEAAASEKAQSSVSGPTCFQPV